MNDITQLISHYLPIKEFYQLKKVYPFLKVKVYLDNSSPNLLI